MKSVMNKQSGFTLIELMIVVAIIAILAAIAMPAYQNYTKKARFAEVVAMTGAVKTAVELCISNLGTKTGCSGTAGNTVGIPVDIAAATGKLASLETLNGTITATAISTGGLSGETYILTPTVNTGNVTWVVTGSCSTASPPIC